MQYFDLFYSIRLHYETLDPDLQTPRNHNNFTDSLLQIFQVIQHIFKEYLIIKITNMLLNKSVTALVF